MDLLAMFIENYYLPNKESFSQQMAQKDQVERAPLPKLGSADNTGRLTLGTVQALNDQCAKLTYTADPMGGLTDYYNHPEYSQWRLDNRRFDKPMDCDDFAVYVLALARKCGMAEQYGWIWNLIIAPTSQITQTWANHVIAAFEFVNHQGTWTAVLDTNSAAQKKVFWFKGDRSQTQQAVIEHFSRVYSVNYYKLLTVKYPF